MSSWMISRQGSRKPDAMGSSEELPEAHKEQAQNVTTITEEGEPTASQQNTNSISVDEKKTDKLGNCEKPTYCLMAWPPTGKNRSPCT